jgi:hypothetical protein
LPIYSETLSSSHPPIAGAAQKNSAQFLVNARECIRCERDQRHNHSIIRIVRLKPNGAGDLRAAGPLIEFAERHLPNVITMLQALASEAT